MNILIAGASGFIGKELVKSLSLHHQISVIGRDLKKLTSTFPSEIICYTWDNFSNQDPKQFDLIINLTGSNIGEKRWSAKVKKELIESRTQSNEHLIQWLISNKASVRFFCANAVGIYGAYEESNLIFDESSTLPTSAHDFLQHIGLCWQQSLKPAIDANIPVTILRFGVVLKPGEGMLKKLNTPFRLGLGSVLGSGKQTLSWVYYQDLLRAIEFLIHRPDITGAVNITSPYPVDQKTFAHALAKSLKRPLFFTTPAWVVKCLFGEMGEYLLLRGQYVIPKRLNDLGFKFSHPKIESAL